MINALYLEIKSAKAPTMSITDSLKKDWVKFVIFHLLVIKRFKKSEGLQLHKGWQFSRHLRDLSLFFNKTFIETT